ncbi:MAG: hypothetical protein AAFR52_06960, partial [Pseudomonadota bacterium]
MQTWLPPVAVTLRHVSSRRRSVAAAGQAWDGIRAGRSCDGRVGPGNDGARGAALGDLSYRARRRCRGDVRVIELEEVSFGYDARPTL